MSLDGIGCGCGCDDEGGGSGGLPPSQDPREAIDVRGAGEIQVTESYDGNVKVFTVARVPYTPPQIVATANPTREVGDLVDFEWDGSIVQGQRPITFKKITPSGEDLESPFERTVADATRDTRGFLQAYHIEVRDNVPTIVTKDLGINFVNKVYQGFSFKDGVTTGQEIGSAEILAMTGSLVDNIKIPYGGAHTYNVPVSAVLQYIYWVYELGTTPISGMVLSGLPFPLQALPNVVMNNVNGKSVTYVVIRSANKFGTGPLTLTML